MSFINYLLEPWAPFPPDMDTFLATGSSTAVAAVVDGAFEDILPAYSDSYCCHSTIHRSTRSVGDNHGQGCDSTGPLIEPGRKKDGVYFNFKRHMLHLPSHLLHIIIHPLWIVIVHHRLSHHRIPLIQIKHR